MKIAAIINGYPRSGKDTVCGIAETVLWDKYRVAMKSLSSIDPIDAMLRESGHSFDRRTPEGRKLLSDVKFALDANDMRATRMIISRALNSLGYPGDRCVFIHAREPKAIAFMKQEMKVDLFVTLFVDRPGCEVTVGNEADVGVRGYAYDWTISNDSSLEDLQIATASFCDLLVAKARAA